MASQQFSILPILTVFNPYNFHQIHLIPQSEKTLLPTHDLSLFICSNLLISTFMLKISFNNEHFQWRPLNMFFSSFFSYIISAGVSYLFYFHFIFVLLSYHICFTFISYLFYFHIIFVLLSFRSFGKIWGWHLDNGWWLAPKFPPKLQRSGRSKKWRRWQFGERWQLGCMTIGRKMTIRWQFGERWERRQRRYLCQCRCFEERSRSH